MGFILYNRYNRLYVCVSPLYPALALFLFMKRDYYCYHCWIYYLAECKHLYQMYGSDQIAYFEGRKTESRIIDNKCKNQTPVN